MKSNRLEIEIRDRKLDRLGDCLGQDIGREIGREIRDMKLGQGIAVPKYT